MRKVAGITAIDVGITGGKTYAELDQDDPNRRTVMNSAFLQASLFTSVVAVGVARMAFVLGTVPTLIGFAIRTPVVVEAGSAAVDPVPVALPERAA